MRFSTAWAKSPLASVTMWGALAMAIALALNVFGIEVTQAEIQQILEKVAAAVGLVLVIWGRWRADKPLAVYPERYPVR